MAGGKGTRLWPESTEERPKQYLKLFGDQSLLQGTLSRYQPLCSSEQLFIVTTQEQKSLALEQSRDVLNEGQIIIEPQGRDTAACILLSLAFLESKGLKDYDILAFAPSDHIILQREKFIQTMERAIQRARESEHIVTIGIRPHFPHTGFGYIKKSRETSINCYLVDQFVEKPDLETAKEYLISGDYFWNAGLFLAKLGVFKSEFMAHAPELFQYYDQMIQALRGGINILPLYEQLKKISIDYAIMEKSHKIEVTPADFDWNDLGSWKAFSDVIEEKEGNTVIQSPGVRALDSKGNLIFSSEQKISLVGINDLVIVSNSEHLLLMKKERAEEVKKILNLSF